MVFPERARVSRKHIWLCLAAGSLFITVTGACGDDDQPATIEPQPENPEVITPSLDPQVKLKNNDRLRNDMARALGLEASEVCNELGRYSCTHDVHRLTLGGTAAYDLSLFQPLRDAALTSPLAAERVAMSACVQRVERDLAGDSTGEPLIFGSLDIDAGGKLTRVDAAAVATAIDTLYKRAVQRRALDSEIEALRQLYRDIEARQTERPARDWAVLSCFAVMTSMEQLFY